MRFQGIFPMGKSERGSNLKVRYRMVPNDNRQSPAVESMQCLSSHVFRIRFGCALYLQKILRFRVKGPKNTEILCLKAVKIKNSEHIVVFLQSFFNAFECLSVLGKDIEGDWN